MDYLFHGVVGLKCLKSMPAKELKEVTRICCRNRSRNLKITQYVGQHLMLFRMTCRLLCVHR